MSASDPRPTVYVPSTTVFKADIFKGKVLFCTGGGSGICQTMTRDVMMHGANAVIVGRKQNKLDESCKWLEEQCKAQGVDSKVIGVSADVRKPEELKKAAQKTIETFGRIDFVIAGAAGNFLAPIEGLSENAFKTIIEIDLLGSFNTLKATIPHVLATQGAYIFVSANLGSVPWQSAAAAAKAAIDSLNQSVAVEFGPKGVRTLSLSPGLIGGTEGADRLTPKGAQDYIASQIPLQRAGDKGDISNATVFFFSGAASYISGHKLVVDGAQYQIGGPFLPYPDSQLDPQSIKELVNGSKL